MQITYLRDIYSSNKQTHQHQKRSILLKSTSAKGSNLLLYLQRLQKPARIDYFNFRMQDYPTYHTGLKIAIYSEGNKCAQVFSGPPRGHVGYLFGPCPLLASPYPLSLYCIHFYHTEYPLLFYKVVWGPAKYSRHFSKRL